MAARRRPRIDLSFGPGHGPVSGVLNAAAAMYALTMWLFVGDGSSLWGLTVGILMAAAGVLVAKIYRQPYKVQMFRAACWAGAGAWSAWTLCGFSWLGSSGNPWTWPPLYAILAGSAVIALIGWRMTAEERRAEADAARRALEEAASAAHPEAARLAARVPVNEDEAIAFRWQPILDRIIARRKLVIVGVERWDPEYGFTLDVVLPDDGTVLKDVKGYEEALASAADLPDGCGVELAPNPGMGRRSILIKVTTALALAEDIPAPAVEPDTIENPQVFGVAADGQPVAAVQRYHCVTLVGQVDSGKSNQLNAIIKANAQCTDALMVGVDVTGHGRVFRPWNRPYVEGRAPRPVFAQIAHSQHRARLLAKSLLNIINGRTADYSELMHAERTDKIMVRPELPQIIVYVDEFGALDSDIQDMFAKIADTGRGAGVRGVFCALEATAAYIPGSIVRQSRIRMAMRVADESQLQWLFDTTWSRGRFDPASMPWPGSGLWADGPVAPEKFKGFRVDPARIDQVAVEVAHLRPPLDDLSLRRGDTVTVKVRSDMGMPEDVTFTGVWTNSEAETYPEIFSASRQAGIPAGGTSTMERGSPMANSNPGSAADAARDMNESVGDMMAALERLEKEADQAERDHLAGKSSDRDDEDDPTPSAEELAAWFELPDAQRSPDSPGEAPPANRPHPKRRTLQIVLEQADRGGIGAAEIAAQLATEGYQTDRATVHDWLRKFKATGRVSQPGGQRTPYLPGPKMGDPFGQR